LTVCCQRSGNLNPARVREFQCSSQHP
jgi:hypothetical protein